MTQSNFVKFVIQSETLSVGDIESAISVVVDKRWNAGDRRQPNLGIVEQFSGIHINSGLPPSHLLEDHIWAILKRIAANTYSIKELSNKCLVLLQCSIYCESPPSLYFNAAVVDVLAECGSGLDIDLYIGNYDFPDKQESC